MHIGTASSIQFKIRWYSEGKWKTICADIEKITRLENGQDVVYYRISLLDLNFQETEFDPSEFTRDELIAELAELAIFQRISWLSVFQFFISHSE